MYDVQGRRIMAAIWCNAVHAVFAVFAPPPYGGEYGGDMGSLAAERIGSWTTKKQTRVCFCMFPSYDGYGYTPMGIRFAVEN